MNMRLKISGLLCVAGLLGLALATARAQPFTSRVVAWGYQQPGQTNVPASLTNASAVAAGQEHSLALRADGRVVAWGLNGQGQTDVPPSLTNAMAVAAGGYHSLALRADGTVMAWGYNGAGQTNVPANLTNVIAIAAGSEHSLALRVDGRVVAWGGNDYGQTNVPPSLTNASAVAAGGYHSLALRADGTVVAWGSSFWGQTTVPANLTNATAIAAGKFYSLALRVDGRVVAWGDNYDGQTNVPANLTNGIAIAAGQSHSLALRANGRVVAWGLNGQGQTDVPVNLTNAFAIAAGQYHSLALTSSSRAVVQVMVIPSAAALGPIQSGTPVSLCGYAYGPGPPSYQWQCNGSAVPGATNAALHFAALQLSHNGASYRLHVTNPYGITTSAPVALSVQALVVSVNGSALASTNFFFGTAVVGSAIVELASSFINARIFYTLDGSPPDFTANWFAGAFTITNSVVLRAIAYSADWTDWDEAGPFYLTRNYYYTLNSTTAGGGTVSQNPPDSSYLNFTNVTATATPNPGWTFLRWEGAASGTNPVVSVFMDTNKTVWAVFGTRLGTTPAGHGSVTLDAPDGWYAYGTAARLTGVPQPGSYFGYWGNAAGGNANPLLFTVTSPSPVVSCIFGTLATNQAALTVQIAGNGQVVRAPLSNAYNLNQSVTLTATAGSGQKFQGWSGDATGSQNPLTVVMDRSRVVTAFFQTNNSAALPQIVQQPASVTVAVGSPASFTVLASGGLPLAYQWCRNGVGLPGATASSHTLAAARWQDAGGYSVVVTNAFGSVTSAVATLTVTVTSRITAITWQPGGCIALEATGLTGRNLLFSTSTNLLDWTPWVMLPNPSGTAQVLDPAPPVGQKFYRVEQP